MWRCPQENNQKQNQRICRYLVGHGGPAQYRRHGAGGAANDNVLRCQRLQDHGVDHRITDKGTKRQPHGQRVDPDIQNHRTGDTQNRREKQGLHVAQVTARRRTPGRALHFGVYAFFHNAIEGRRRTGYQPDTQTGNRRRHHIVHTRNAGYRQNHPNQRAKDNELDHPRLGQGLVLTPSRQGFDHSGWSGKRVVRHNGSVYRSSHARAATEKPDQHHQQGTCATCVQHRRQQGPTQDHIAQAGGDLQR